MFELHFDTNDIYGMENKINVIDFWNCDSYYDYLQF